MKLRLLRYFVVVAEEKSFVRPSGCVSKQRLCREQSGISNTTSASICSIAPREGPGLLRRARPSASPAFACLSSTMRRGSTPIRSRTAAGSGCASASPINSRNRT